MTCICGVVFQVKASFLYSSSTYDYTIIICKGSETKGNVPDTENIFEAFLLFSKHLLFLLLLLNVNALIK